ncbi:dihydroorotate dehydrogenase electron transfer subunit [Feifania hominis]|uniref:Dihydroorotate dehydrogenase B (NAD(+)), electron transfer subunit n=1 Tax=Feifania hominis TaxID=2763660 RepID=A0A926HTQ1_9FIRM|nr:dihydroorotate dehydrogenase electron transfer subunit [Feifania hominis]MBC8535115.1 dihydroorotate dehydrogenase electron transfer subunit [Feifania hominis]
MRQICKIVKKEFLTPDIVDLRFYSQEIAAACFPGQFVHILCSPAQVLRRPISICDVEGGAVRVLFEVRGGGTEYLSRLEPGDAIDVLGPVGNGFSDVPRGERALFVGGGIGIFPLLMPARRCDKTPSVILGFRDISRVVLVDDFRKLSCNLSVMSDNGSFGERGFVTDKMAEILRRGEADRVYACGPKAMLKAVAELAAQYSLPCEVSMEERMGCGIGACLVCACAVRRANGERDYVHVCKDGPVFDASEVDFDA